MCIIQRDTHRIIDANTSYRELTGYSGEELVDRVLSDLEQWDEPDHPRVSALWKGHAVRDLMVDIRTKHGELRSTCRTVEHVELNGEACALVSYFDITERKRLEALRRREEQFRLLFEHSPDAIMVIDPHDPSGEWPIIDCNAVACAMHSYTHEEMVGLSLQAITKDPDDRQSRADYLDWIRSVGVHSGEDVHVRRDGTLLLVEFTTSLIVVNGRELLLGVDREITDRKRLDNLRASEQQFRVLFEQLPDALVLLDPHEDSGNWLIADCNEAACRMYGYTRKQMRGRLFTMLQERSLEDTTITLERLRETGSVYGEAMHRRKDGTMFPTEHTSSLIVIDDKEYVLRIHRDITLRRQSESALRDSEERFRMLFEASPDSIVLIDPHDSNLPWRIVDANEAACRLNGYERHELIGLANNQLRVEDDWMPNDAFLDALRAGPVHGFDTHRRKDGSLVPTEFSATMVHVGGRELVLGINRDITERLQVEDALRSNEEYLRAVVENGADVIAVLEPEGTVRYLSPSFERVFGSSPHEHIGVPGFSFIDPVDMPHAEELFDRLLTHPDQTITMELRMKHPDGLPRTVEIAAKNMSTHSVVRGIVINARDVTERRRMEQQLIHDASHDALTGLPNRLLFFDRLAKALELSVRNEHRQCAVLFLDLDRFKTINDSLGHGVGDQLLMAVSKRLEHCIRPGDTVARFGGDEFAILLQDLDDITIASNTAERICTAIEAPYMIAGLEMVTSASVGIALSGMTEMQPEELLRDADIAMYRAKRLGRGRYAMVDPTVHVMLKDRLQMEGDLRRALERDEFELYYQPKVAIDGVRIVGLEALIRWRHPERGFVSPAEFIPVAEDTGLIVPLGAWVLRTACTQLKAWHDEGLPHLYVAVNLSAVQFRRPDIAQSIRAIIEETGLEPRYVALELTESILMEDVATTSEALHNLRAIDIGHVSVDDFGTGYSSLSYLQQFPISTIKIDRSFINDVTTNPGSSAIAAAIIALAHSLQLVTVAEGVETEDQLRWLQDHDCDAFQGYLFSRPLPVQDITRLLATTVVDA